MEVTPEMSSSSESHFQKFLDFLLNHKDFRKEDEVRYKDIAVILGLNGRKSDVQKNKRMLRVTFILKNGFYMVK